MNCIFAFKDTYTCRELQYMICQYSCMYDTFLLIYAVCIHILIKLKGLRYTLPETNMTPENLWLEDEFPFGMAYSGANC